MTVQIDKQYEFIADYVLGLFLKDKQFPRDGGFNGSWRRYPTTSPISSRQELINELARASLVDSYICIHSVEQVKSGELNNVFTDIDMKDNLERARKIAFQVSDKVYEWFGVKPLVQFSGAKGFHIITPTIPVIIGKQAGEFLEFVQIKISKNYCDPAIRHDVNRVFRIPFSINSKGSKVKVLQEWDGKRADLLLLEGSFKLYQLSKELNEKKQTSMNKKRTYINGDTPKNIQEILNGVGEGNRHESALILALHFAGKGFNEAGIFNELVQWDSRNKPPMGEQRHAELRRIAKDAVRYNRK